MEGMDVDLDAELMQKFSCLGTTDKDVLIGEFQRLLGFQLSPAGCAFFLDMTNWYSPGWGEQNVVGRGEEEAAECDGEGGVFWLGRLIGWAALGRAEGRPGGSLRLLCQAQLAPCPGKRCFCRRGYSVEAARSRGLVTNILT